MKRACIVLMIAFGITLPLLGDGAKKAQPLVEPDVVERWYTLPDQQADVLALLLRLYPPRQAQARTEVKDDRLALVVKGPKHVHEAVGNFVDFLNAEQAGKEADAKQRAIEHGRTQFIIKDGKASPEVVPASSRRPSLAGGFHCRRQGLVGRLRYPAHPRFRGILAIVARVQP